MKIENDRMSSSAIFRKMTIVQLAFLFIYRIFYSYVFQRYLSSEIKVNDV